MLFMVLRNLGRLNPAEDCRALWVSAIAPLLQVPQSMQTLQTLNHSTACKSAWPCAIFRPSSIAAQPLRSGGIGLVQNAKAIHCSW